MDVLDSALFLDLDHVVGIKYIRHLDVAICIDSNRLSLFPPGDVVFHLTKSKYGRIIRVPTDWKTWEHVNLAQGHR